MSDRKTREARARATEDAVFAYRPPSAGRRMMANSDEPEEDEDDVLITDDAPEGRIQVTLGELKRAIRRMLNHV